MAQKALTYKATVFRQNPMFFPQLTLLFNNLVLTSYSSGIYLGGVQKTLKKRRTQTEEKHWKVKRKKNGEYEESQITAICIFGFKLYFARKNNLKKSCLYVYISKSYLQFLWVAEYLKHSSDTPKLNIHKYTS